MLYFSIKELSSGEIRIQYYRAKVMISVIKREIYFLFHFLPQILFPSFGEQCWGLYDLVSVWALWLCYTTQSFPPSIILWFLAVRAHCWLEFNLMSTRTSVFCRNSWSEYSAHPLKPWLKQSPLALKAESHIVPETRKIPWAEIITADIKHFHKLYNQL